MSTPAPVGCNWIVPSLSEASRSVMEWVVLEPLQVLEARGEPPAHVYFPVGCAIALLLPLASGATGLAALVGQEGLVGVEAFLGSGSRVTNAVAMVQSAGPAWRLPAGQFQYEVSSNFALQQRLTRYTLALVSQMARIAACARHHSVEQQIARWLLQSADRAPAQPLPMDPEGVAALLALDRDAVLAALAGLERQGGIVYGDSQLMLRDRTPLLATACTCYGAMRDSELRALLPDATVGSASSRQNGASSEPVES